MIIHFVGGIHGVGKGSICHQICEQTDLLHLMASKLLKWEEISTANNKKVANIQDTQDRLMAGLNNATKADKSYLLDGHFCLFNKNGIIERVPPNTFAKISPKSIVVVTAEDKLIKQRLENRDGKIYNLDILENMQNEEKAYAKETAILLNIPFIEIKNGNYDEFIGLIQNG